MRAWESLKICGERSFIAEVVKRWVFVFLNFFLWNTWWWLWHVLLYEVGFIYVCVEKGHSSVWFNCFAFVYFYVGGWCGGVVPGEKLNRGKISGWKREKVTSCGGVRAHVKERVSATEMGRAQHRRPTSLWVGEVGDRCKKSEQGTPRGGEWLWPNARATSTLGMHADGKRARLRTASQSPHATRRVCRLFYSIYTAASSYFSLTACWLVAWDSNAIGDCHHRWLARPHCCPFRTWPAQFFSTGRNNFRRLFGGGVKKRPHSYAPHALGGAVLLTHSQHTCPPPQGGA